jgi:hypothetical protein
MAGARAAQPQRRNPTQISECVDTTCGTTRTLDSMADVVKIVAAMRRNPLNVRYDDLRKVCQHYFGAPRHDASSHAVFKTPWPGDPRVNIQDDKGKAKGYQVKQVLKAIEKMEEL